MFHYPSLNRFPLPLSLFPGNPNSSSFCVFILKPSFSKNLLDCISLESLISFKISFALRSLSEVKQSIIQTSKARLINFVQLDNFFSRFQNFAEMIIGLSGIKLLLPSFILALLTASYLNSFHSIIILYILFPFFFPIFIPSILFSFLPSYFHYFLSIFIIAFLFSNLHFTFPLFSLISLYSLSLIHFVVFPFFVSLRPSLFHFLFLFSFTFVCLFYFFLLYTFYLSTHSLVLH